MVIDSFKISYITVNVTPPHRPSLRYHSRTVPLYIVLHVSFCVILSYSTFLFGFLNAHRTDATALWTSLRIISPGAYQRCPRRAAPGAKKLIRIEEFYSMEDGSLNSELQEKRATTNNEGGLCVQEEGTGPFSRVQVCAGSHFLFVFGFSVLLFRESRDCQKCTKLVRRCLLPVKKYVALYVFYLLSVGQIMVSTEHVRPTDILPPHYVL